MFLRMPATFICVSFRFIVVLMIAAGGYPKRDDAGSSTISETLCVNNINSYRRGRLDELRDVCVIAYMSVAKGGVVVVVAATAGALRE